MPAGNEPLLFAQAERIAFGSSGGGSEHHSLQHRGSDAGRWVEVGRFPSRAVAKTTLQALVAAGHGPAKDFRIRKVTIPPRA